MDAGVAAAAAGPLVPQEHAGGLGVWGELEEETDDVES